MIPPIHLKNLLMVPSKGARLLRLPEDPSACSDEMVMEQPLMERPLPSLAIQRFQGLSALLNPLEPTPRFRLRCAVEVCLQGVARNPPCSGLPGLSRLNVVVGGEEGSVVYWVADWAVHIHCLINIDGVGLNTTVYWCTCFVGVNDANGGGLNNSVYKEEVSYAVY